MYKIGVIARPDQTKMGNSIWEIHDDIRKAILKFNGFPIIIVPTNISYQKQITKKEFLELESLLKCCDGFIFQGGDDFYPFDLKIIGYAYQNNIPSLGICLGMQSMASLFGGTLQKITNSIINHHQKNQDYVHLVNINLDSKLYKIIKESPIKVNSRHHECITKTDLSIVATSSDHIIEAVEDKEKDFFIGVQWHPESMMEYDIVSKNLLVEFFNAVGRYHENRKINGYPKGKIIKTNKK